MNVPPVRNIGFMLSGGSISSFRSVARVMQDSQNSHVGLFPECSVITLRRCLRRCCMFNPSSLGSHWSLANMFIIITHTPSILEDTLNLDGKSHEPTS